MSLQIIEETRSPSSQSDLHAKVMRERKTTKSSFTLAPHCGHPQAKVGMFELSFLTKVVGRRIKTSCVRNPRCYLTFRKFLKGWLCPKLERYYYLSVLLLVNCFLVLSVLGIPSLWTPFSPSLFLFSPPYYVFTFSVVFVKICP